MLNNQLRDPLFKGCTRPAMVFGVPIVPFMLTVAFFALLSVYINLLIALLIIPIIGIMRMITKQDDQQFRLLYLKYRFHLPCRNKEFWHASTHSPLTFRNKHGLFKRTARTSFKRKK